MLIQPQNKLEKAIRLKYDTDEERMLKTSQNTLRILIGVLGMMLPLTLWLVVLIDTSHYSPLYSISHYYFSRACSVFVIVVSMLAIFLLVYKGKRRVDFYFSAIAGIFALSLLLFPTNSITEEYPDAKYPYYVSILKQSDFRTAFHYISAAIFLSSLAYMSAFIFTKSQHKPEDRTKQKRQRNRVFRTCAAIMTLAILGILTQFLGPEFDAAFKRFNLTFWLETVAVECFGFAWLVKAEVFFRDKETEKEPLIIHGKLTYYGKLSELKNNLHDKMHHFRKISESPDYEGLSQALKDLNAMYAEYQKFVEHVKDKGKKDNDIFEGLGS